MLLPRLQSRGWLTRIVISISLASIGCRSPHREPVAVSERTESKTTESKTTGTQEEATMQETDRPKSIRYERSGGIAGLIQNLEVLDGERIAVTDRRLGSFPERPLTEEEQAELGSCLDSIGELSGSSGAKSFPGDPYVSDGFRVAIYVDGSETATLTATSPQLPITGTGEWDPLLAWLDARLRSEIETGSGSRYKIRSVE